MLLKARIDSHKELIEQINRFLDDKTNTVPGIGLGRFEGRAYKSALIIDKIYETIDKIIEEESTKAADSGHSVTCHQGCSACCHQPVGGPIAESFLIAEYLDQNPILKENFLEKYFGWRKQVNPDKYTERMNRLGERVSPRPNEREVQKAVQSFSAYSPACPFLESDGCSIYPVRPLACRQHLSVDNPKKCLTNEKTALLRMDRTYQFINDKVIPLMLKVSQNFEIKAIINNVSAVSVYEYLQNGERYIKHIAKETEMRLNS